MISSLNAFNIASIVFFFPAFVSTLLILRKHGLKNEVGWYWLTLFCVIRIVGAALGFAAASTSSSIKTAISLVMSSTGSILLVVVFAGIVNRIETGSGRSWLSPDARRWVNIMSLIAFILGTVGGTKIYDDDDDSCRAGKTYIQVSTVLVFVHFLISVAMLAWAVGRRMQHVMSGDSNLVMCAATSLPFVFVRMVYLLCSVFNPYSASFSFRSSTTLAVALRACLALAVEIVIVGLYIVGGLLAPVVPLGETKEESS